MHWRRQIAGPWRRPVDARRPAAVFPRAMNVISSDQQSKSVLRLLYLLFQMGQNRVPTPSKIQELVLAHPCVHTLWVSRPYALVFSEEIQVVFCDLVLKITARQNVEAILSRVFAKKDDNEDDRAINVFLLAQNHLPVTIHLDIEISISPRVHASGSDGFDLNGESFAISEGKYVDVGCIATQDRACDTTPS